MNAQPMATATVIPGPPGTFYRMAWIGDTLYVHASPIGGVMFVDSAIWQVPVDGSTPTKLTLPQRPGCERQSAYLPTRLPTNDLGFMLVCKRFGLAIVDQYLMEYNLQTGRSIPFRTEPLFSQGLSIGSYALNPGMTRGIMSDGNHLVEQLYWFTSTTTQTIPMEVQQANSVSWSPDGTTIAFFGTQQTSLGASFMLYVMQPDKGEKAPLVEQIHDPQGLAWSPDSHWIVFAGTRGTIVRHQGLWLVNRTTGKCTLLVSGNYVAPTWSPDGKQIAAIRDLGIDTTEIIHVDIATLVHEQNE